jgi:DNA-binding response OmpR family regulator
MEEQSFDGYSVLIIDDEDSLRSILAQKFKDEGIASYTAADGREGVEVALLRKPDIILLDVMMPEMDGFDVLEELRKDEWGKDVSVILLTNSSSVDTVAKAVATGMSEFLVKTEMKLEEVVEHVKERFAAA